MGLSIWTLISILCFIPALVLHECAHGFVADKMGDHTARRLGRLSLNPLKHIDPFGTVALPLLLAVTNLPVFGYAKPVPYNPNNFRDLRKGELLTGLAGPAANLVMGLLGALVGYIAMMFMSTSTAEAALWVRSIAYYFTLVNFYLMFFNLIPIPPLDGSSIVAVFLSDRALVKYYSIQQYAMPILMIVLIALPMLLNFSPLGLYLNSTAGNLAGFLFSLR